MRFIYRIISEGTHRLFLGFLIGNPPVLAPGQNPGVSCEDLWIAHGHGHHQVVVIDALIALLYTHVHAMRVARFIQPCGWAELLRLRQLPVKSVQKRGLDGLQDRAYTEGRTPDEGRSEHPVSGGNSS